MPEQPAPTSAEIRQRILDLSVSALSLAALTASLELGLLDELSLPQAPARIAGRTGAPEGLVTALLEVLVAEGMASPAPTPEGPGFVCGPGMAAFASGHAKELFLGDLRSTQLQAQDLVSRAAKREVAVGGWSHDDPEILQAQGLRSAEPVAMLATQLFPRLEGLEERLGAPGAGFLDIGTGVGLLAIEMCRRYPALRVLGLDPHRGALDLARTNVASARLEGRIELRAQSVEDLAAREAFDLSWVPVMFLSHEVAARGLERVLGALRPGGWAVLGSLAAEGDTPGAAVNRLLALLWGSTGLGAEQAGRLLEAAGYTSVRVLDPIPGAAVRLTVGRRPADDG